MRGDKGAAAAELELGTSIHSNTKFQPHELYILLTTLNLPYLLVTTALLSGNIENPRLEACTVRCDCSELSGN